MFLIFLLYYLTFEVKRRLLEDIERDIYMFSPVYNVGDILK